MSCTLRIHSERNFPACSVLFLVSYLAPLRPNARVVAALTLAALLVCGAVSAQTPAGAQATAPQDIGGAAKLLSFTGQISVMRDSTAWALKTGDLVQPQQVVVTGVDGGGMF